MALESERVAEAAEMNPGNRRARSERRGKDRRLGQTRINHVAPRRSLMKAFGASATAMSCAVFAIVILATAMIAQTIPWIALSVSGMAVVISAFFLMLGSLEQRLIEIRLELMMANGGMRQADRRNGDRRSGSRSNEEPMRHAPAHATTTADVVA
ncbi:hypothetical protein MMB232_00625 [Brevundimonas subvibrioides]|uniref:hypothetical protein n=1 Tax=Brevundimonas subvibrioides TaxID=74313 RepID=UPI0032D59FF0